MQIWIGDTGAPGWAEVSTPELSAAGKRVLIMIDRHDGRWAITRLVVAGDVLDSATVKAVPVARLEAMLNTADVGRRLLESNRGRRTAVSQAPDGTIGFREETAAELIRIGDDLTAYLARVPPHDTSPDADRPQPQREPLGRPDGSDAEGFYRRVAETYSAVVRETSSPAKVIAEEAGVPVPTVHRWIHEARRRGYLPPARKGRAG